MVVATAEVDIPESWSGVVHDAPFARHAKPRSWLEWAQLLYSERHLHPRGDGRVAPATALPAFTLCDVAVSRAYTLEMTATAGGEKPPPSVSWMSMSPDGVALDVDGSSLVAPAPSRGRCCGHSCRATGARARRSRVCRVAVARVFSYMRGRP